MKLFLHLGWGKSGTTWLQSQLFNQKKVFKNFDKYRLHNLVDPNWGIYDEKNVKKVFIDFIEGAGRSGLNTCISSEGIIGSLRHKPEVHETMMYRIGRVYEGEKKIILFIRNHADILSSLYIEYLETYHNITFQKFLKKFHYQIRYLYAYSDRIRFCQNLFGVENVFVGALEELSFSPNSLKNRLENFVGKDLDDFDMQIKPNSKPSYLAYERTRWVTPFWVRNIHNFYHRYFIRESKKPSTFILNKYRNSISKNISEREELLFRSYLKKEIDNVHKEFFKRDAECLSEIIDLDINNIWNFKK